jgi:flavin-dependent dehydrogenase
VHDVARDGAGMLVNCDQGQLRSHVLVDGTGSQRLMAAQLGSQAILCSPRIVARYGYRAGDAPRLSSRPLFTVKQSGWQWIARVRPGVYQWMNACWGDDRPDGDDIPRQLRELRETAPARGADVSWRILREPASRGLFDVCDAAALVDPSSSHGVLRALSTGIMAAHCIQAQLRGTAKASAAEAFYSGWVRRWFAADCDRLSGIYSACSPYSTYSAASSRPVVGSSIRRASRGRSAENRRRDP